MTVARSNKVPLGTRMPRTETMVLDELLLPGVMASERKGCELLTIYTGVTVVLKFLKFQNCPEITDCPEILGIW